MRPRVALLAALLVATPLAGCLDPGSGGQDDPAASAPCPHEGLPDEHRDLATDGGLQAYWNTTRGDVVIELYHERAPVTVANHVRYAAEGFYGGTIFHRVIDGFVIQGGGFDANLTKLDTHDPIPLERHPDLSNTRGTLSMARTQNPNSATTQFFVNLEDNTDTLDKGAGYAVFGEVVGGMDVVDAIAEVPTTKEEGRENVPEEDVAIRCVSLDLPEGDGDPPVRATAVQGPVTPPPSEPGEVPFQIVNDWDAPRQVEVEAAADAAGVSVPRADDGTIRLPPGGSALAVATVPAGTQGEAGLRLTFEDGTTTEATAGVDPTGGTGPSADRTNDTRVDARFVGLLESGVPFGANEPDLDEREGLRILPEQGALSDPLKVWTSDEDPPNGSDYRKVIPGFRDALLGLREGQTNLDRVPPDQAYQDGITRWFHVSVQRVRSR